MQPIKRTTFCTTSSTGRTEGERQTMLDDEILKLYAAADDDDQRPRGLRG